MTRETIHIAGLVEILNSDKSWDEREDQVRSLVENAGVIGDDELRKELAEYQSEINDGIGHFSDLKIIIDGIPRARGNAGPGFHALPDGNIYA